MNTSIKPTTDTFETLSGHSFLRLGNLSCFVFFTSEKLYSGNPGFHRFGPLLGPIQFSLEYSLHLIVMYIRVGLGTLSLSTSL